VPGLESLPSVATKNSTVGDESASDSGAYTSQGKQTPQKENTHEREAIRWHRPRVFTVFSSYCERNRATQARGHDLRNCFHGVKDRTIERGKGFRPRGSPTQAYIRTQGLLCIAAPFCLCESVLRVWAGSRRPGLKDKLRWGVLGTAAIAPDVARGIAMSRNGVVNAIAGRDLAR